MYYKIVNKRKRYLTRIADILGYAVWAPLTPFRRKSFPSSGIRDILIIRTAYLGDVVMTIPLLGPLKQRYPDARISFLTSKAAGEILKNNPYLYEIINYDPFWFYPTEKSEYFRFIKEFRKRSFDLVIEARGDLRELLFLVLPLKSRFRVGFAFGGGGFVLTHTVPYGGVKHKLEYHLDIARFLGCDVSKVEGGVYLTDDEKRAVRGILTGNGITRPFITAHPGARHRLRRWFADRYARLYDRIMDEYDIPVVLLGSPDEKDSVKEIISKMRNKAISLAGGLSIRELSGVVSESLLFICNNSGPMHIAASMKVPTVVIHGPSKTYWDAPYGNVHRIIEKPMPCRDDCDEGSCRNERFHECMESIGVDDVFDAVKELLEATGRRNNGSKA